MLNLKDFQLILYYRMQYKNKVNICINLAKRLLHALLEQKLLLNNEPDTYFTINMKYFSVLSSLHNLFVVFYPEIKTKSK